MKRAQTCENTTSEPTAVASLSRITGGMDFSLGDDKTSCTLETLTPTHVVEYPVQLVVQSVSKAPEQASPSSKHHVAQQNLANVWIA